MELGWVSTYNQVEYYADDPAVMGLGNPPSCPAFQTENPGQGRLPMEAKMLPDRPTPEPEAP